MSGHTTETPVREPNDPDRGVDLRTPTLDDGREMWRIARDSQVLDVNASYAYLLWCRDFSRTSVVATVDGRPGGFVSGFRRPDQADTLMVWQVAVDEEHRGRRLATRMLEHLVDSVGPATLETTITPDNAASIALFTRFAEKRGADVEQTPVFEAAHFPDGHDAEMLFRIGPLG